MVGKESDGEDDEYKRMGKPLKDKYREVNYGRKGEQEMGEEKTSDQQDVEGKDAQMISASSSSEEENSDDQDTIDSVSAEEMERFTDTFNGFEKCYS